MKIYNIIGAIIRFFDPNYNRIYCESCGWKTAKYKISDVKFGSNEPESFYLCGACKENYNHRADKIQHITK